MSVRCYNTAGALADTDYTVLVFAPSIGVAATVLANAGSGQSAAVGTNFAAPLSALVTDQNGNPIPGVTVTFNAPSAGASGMFDGSLTAIAVTNPSGVATSPAFAANGTTGAYSVTASVVGVANPANFNLNNTALVPITITTLPAGLLVSIDNGAFEAAPVNEQWVPGSAHAIATETPQAGVAGVQYVWQNWSDGGTIGHKIAVPGAESTFTANFTTQYQLAISAAPSAGGSVAPASGTYYNSGTVVALNALPNAGYTFSGWTGPVANPANTATAVTMNAPETVTANFVAATTNITIQTNPEGLQFSVDGGPLQIAPQVLNLSQTTHTITVMTTQAGTPGTQYLFTVWSDGGAASHSITVTGNPAIYAARFQAQFQLTISASPAPGGLVTPASGAYYNSGTVVPITAAANPGNTFSNWSGPVANASSASTAVAMNAPATVTADFTASVLACSFTFTPPSASLPPTGTSTVETCPNGSGQPNCGVLPETPVTVTITPSPSCGAWTVTSSNPSLLQITSGASGGTGSRP